MICLVDPFILVDDIIPSHAVITKDHPLFPEVNSQEIGSSVKPRYPKIKAEDIFILKMSINRGPNMASKNVDPQNIPGDCRVTRVLLQ